MHKNSQCLPCKKSSCGPTTIIMQHNHYPLLRGTEVDLTLPRVITRIPSPRFHPDDMDPWAPGRPAPGKPARGAWAEAPPAARPGWGKHRGREPIPPFLNPGPHRPLTKATARRRPVLRAPGFLVRIAPGALRPALLPPLMERSKAVVHGTWIHAQLQNHCACDNLTKMDGHET